MLEFLKQLACIIWKLICLFIPFLFLKVILFFFHLIEKGFFEKKKSFCFIKNMIVFKLQSSADYPDRSGLKEFLKIGQLKKKMIMKVFFSVCVWLFNTIFSSLRLAIVEVPILSFLKILFSTKSVESYTIKITTCTYVYTVHTFKKNQCKMERKFLITICKEKGIFMKNNTWGILMCSSEHSYA